MSHKYDLLRADLRLRLMEKLSRLVSISPRLYYRGMVFHIPRWKDLKGAFKDVFKKDVYYFNTRKESPLIVDGGGNAGLVVGYWKTLYPQCRIITFEPEPETYAILQLNIEANGFQNVVAHCYALSKAAVQQTFFRPAGQPGSVYASLNAERVTGEQELFSVQTVPLSQFITEPVDLLKLDIEGAESDVLLELEASGRIASVAQIILEYHHNLRQTLGLSGMLGLLERNGFRYLLRAGHAKHARVSGAQDVMVRASRIG